MVLTKCHRCAIIHNVRGQPTPYKINRKELIAMADKKKGLTVIEKYTAISEMLNGTYEGEFSTEQALAFLMERIEQTAKKNASRSENGEQKLSPTQKANETAKDGIVAYLAQIGKEQTVADIMKYAPVCTGKSNQWVTQMLTQLRNENRVVRTEVKGKGYYGLPSTESAEETE